MHGEARARASWPRLLQMYALCASALMFGFMAAGCQEGQGTGAVSTQLSKVELRVDTASTYQPGAGASPAAAEAEGTHQSALIAPEPVAVRVSITAPDIGELSQTVAVGATSLTFLVPQGPNRLVTLVFLDAGGAVLGTGQTLVTIVGNEQVVNVTVSPGIPNTNIASTTTFQSANALQNRPFRVGSALVNNTNGSLVVQAAGHRFRVQGSLTDMSGAFTETPVSPGQPFNVGPGATVSYVTDAVASPLAATGLYRIDAVVQGTSSLAGAFGIRTSFVPAVLRLIREHLLFLIEGAGGAGAFQDRNGATPSRWNQPTGVTRLANGDLVISDTQNNRVRRITSVKGTPVTTTLMGTGGIAPDPDGRSAPNTNVVGPRGVGVLVSDQVVVCETGAHKVREFAVNGGVKTIAGVNGTPGFGGDGQLSTDPSVLLNAPEDVLVVRNQGAPDTLFIADTGNHVVRRIDPNTGIINTVVGVPGQAGDTGDGGAANAARLQTPHALALDLQGNLLIAQDFTDNAGQPRGLIRRVVIATRKISTLAGSRDRTPLGGAFDPEGRAATATRLGRINGIVADAASGFIYFTEQGAAAGTGRVIVIDPELNLRTVAGTGAATPTTSSGPGTDFTLFGPQRLLLSGGQFVFPTSGNTILGLQ